jgi:hypothetical protein
VGQHIAACLPALFVRGSASRDFPFTESRYYPTTTNNSLPNPDWIDTSAV